jgi:hypothetical protein
MIRQPSASLEEDKDAIRAQRPRCVELEPLVVP